MVSEHELGYNYLSFKNAITQPKRGLVPCVWSLFSFVSNKEFVKVFMNIGGPPSNLNISVQPIVNKYREGKVKRTPQRE